MFNLRSANAIYVQSMFSECNLCSIYIHWTDSIYIQRVQSTFNLHLLNSVQSTFNLLSANAIYVQFTFTEQCSVCVQSTFSEHHLRSVYTHWTMYFQSTFNLRRHSMFNIHLLNNVQCKFCSANTIFIQYTIAECGLKFNATWVEG